MSQLHAVALSVCASCGGTQYVCSMWWHSVCALHAVALGECAPFRGTQCVPHAVALSVCAPCGGTPLVRHLRGARIARVAALRGALCPCTVTAAGGYIYIDGMEGGGRSVATDVVQLFIQAQSCTRSLTELIYVRQFNMRFKLLIYEIYI